MLQKILLKKLLKITLINLLLVNAQIGHAQELNCTVQVMSQQIQGTDKRVFETLQTAIFEFMNNRKWTDDKFLIQERIECNLLINITKRNSADDFEGTIQVQSRRPVYKSSYSSPILNALDDAFVIRYIEYEPLEFNENTHTTNLTSILAYYAYLILGFDYDTFSPGGGTPFFQRAQNIVNNAQNAPERGWKAFENTKNRYWIVENLMNPGYKGVRDAMYRYHRSALDLMTEKKEEARQQVTNSLDLVNKVHKDKPGSILVTMFFNAKSDEIVNIYSGAFPDEKAKAVNILSEADPANGAKYQDILKQ